MSWHGSSSSIFSIAFKKSLDLSNGACKRLWGYCLIENVTLHFCRGPIRLFHHVSTYYVWVLMNKYTIVMFGKLLWKCPGCPFNYSFIILIYYYANLRENHSIQHLPYSANGYSEIGSAICSASGELSPASRWKQLVKLLSTLSKYTIIPVLHCYSQSSPFPQFASAYP